MSAFFRATFLVPSTKEPNFESRIFSSLVIYLEFNICILNSGLPWLNFTLSLRLEAEGDLKFDFGLGLIENLLLRLALL